MKEEFLQYIWANALFKNRVFTTVLGKQVSVIDPGRFNRDASRLLQRTDSYRRSGMGG